MKKQTAVECLMQILEQNNIIDLDIIDSDKYYTIIDQAKAMEKEQIINAFYDGCFDTNSWRAEQYYNETYNK
jgi:hypothetical protein